MGRLCRAILAASVTAIALSACTGTIEAPLGPNTCNPGGSACGDTATTTDPRGGEANIDPSSPHGIGPATRFARLSNAQWEHSVQDLLHLDAPAGLSAAFIQEPGDRGYDTVAAAELTIAGDSAQRYQTAAETLAARVAGDATLRARILPSGLPSDAAGRRDAFLQTFGRRAYRRPLTPDELLRFSALFDAGQTLVGGDAFTAGIQVTLEAMLQSPHFLYRAETSVPKDSAIARSFLNGFEVASRLSFALWHTMPSDALLDAAGAGELDDDKGVARWGRTLLEDTRADDVLRSFLEQTFAVAAYGTQDKDPSLGFDAAALAPVLRDEARRFFDEVVLRGKGGIREILTSDVVFVNQATAPFYGFSGSFSSAMVKQTLPKDTRAGLFSQLGFLTKNATRTTSDPVHRGLTVLRKVLCDEPDPPPMMFSLPAPMAGLTTREVYTRATVCGGSCHTDLINPPGFAFESFDAVGRSRTTEAGKTIDASGVVSIRSGFNVAAKKAESASTLAFNGALELVTRLSTTPRVHECYARNLLTYVLGHELSDAERGAGSQLRDTSLSDSDTRSLIVSLLTLDTFRARVDTLE